MICLAKLFTYKREGEQHASRYMKTEVYLWPKHSKSVVPSANILKLVDFRIGEEVYPTDDASKVGECLEFTLIVQSAKCIINYLLDVNCLCQQIIDLTQNISAAYKGNPVKNN